MNFLIRPRDNTIWNKAKEIMAKTGGFAFEVAKPLLISLIRQQLGIPKLMDENQMSMLASLREPHKGVILQSATGEELDALSSSPSVASEIPFVLDSV